MLCTFLGAPFGDRTDNGGIGTVPQTASANRDVCDGVILSIDVLDDE